MAYFTLEEFENITADQRKKNKNTGGEELLEKAQTTQSAPNRRMSGLPTEGEPVSEQEIYRKNVNTQPLTADSRVTSVETDNGNIIDVADIYGKNLFQTPNVNITEKLKKDLGADYDLFASQGIQGGNNPEYIGAFGENFKTGLKSFGRNILNTVDVIKSKIDNKNNARLIKAIERARREAPNNAEVEKGLQIAIKNQNPYEKQATVEKQATEKVLQRRQKTRQENARNSETYGNLPGYGIVRGAGQLAGAFTPTIALNAVAPGLGSATYYTNAYGSAFAQSVGEGATYRQAKQYARLDTALEYARMHAFNVIRGLTPEGSLAGEVMGPNGWRKVADKFVKTNTGRYLFKKTLDVTGAGGMAVLDKVITPYLKRAVYDPDADLANMADVLNAFGGAALVTAVLGALNFKQEYNDINNGYRYTDTFTKDREDINKWFKGVDNLEDAKKMHNAYVKSYADVRNSTDYDPARLAELKEIENAYTSLKAQLKNKSARRSMATNEPQTATETAAEPQADENQLFFLPQGETAQNGDISGGEPIAPIAPTEEVVTERPIEELSPETTALEQRIIDNGRQYTSEEIDNIFDSAVPTEDTALPAEIQATEKALQESGVKFSTTDLDNAISGRQAAKRYETVATKQPITPKTNWRDKLNEIIRGNGDNKEEQLKQLKESVKSEPAKKAIQAEIDKISPNKEQVIKTGVQKNTYKPGIEKSLTTARSEDDTYSRAAARRMLTKRGIDWQTGEEMPVKLTAAQVDKLSYMAERDKQKNYPVYSNNRDVYYQDGLLFELGKDGKVSRMLTSKETGQIINDPNTIKVAKFNYQDTVVPFNQSKTKITSKDIINNRAQTKTAPEKVTGAKVVDTIDGVNVYDKVPDGWVTGSTRAPKGYISVSNNFATYGVPNKQVGYVKKADATASESQEADTKILQNSDKVIEKDIENFAKKNFTKSDRKIYLTDNGYTYLTNGYYILRIEGEINEATIKSLDDNGYSFEKNERLKNFLKLTPNDNLKIDMKPKYFPASGDKGDVPKYVFEVGKDKYWTVNKRYFDKLNNPGVRFMTVEKSDDKGRILQGAKAVDENGDVVGFVLPIRLNVENLKEFYESGEDVKGNFFKKKAPKSKATLEKEKAGRLQSQESEESIQDLSPESQEKRVENSEINVSEREKEAEKLQSLESEESIQADIERIDTENKNLENELENSTDEPDTDESITVPTTTRATRYEIDEKTAKLARNMRSQRGYKAGEATSEYNEYLTKAEEIAKIAKEKNPAESERIDYLLNKYSQKIAQNINAVSANESKYPAWFVSGPARYNVKKNDALMRRTMDLFNQRKSYEKILDKIQRIGNGTEAIKSSDTNAVEKLTEKLEKLKRYHSQAKIANAYYKKNGSLEGFHPVGLTEEQEKILFEGARWMKEHYPTVTAPFNLTNSNAEIHRLEDRIKNIQSAKETGNKDVVTNSNYRVVKNAEEMRLQYFFDGKPDREVINIMKSNGFRWSHKNMAWQRQLTANAAYASRRVNEALNKFYGESKPTEQATEDKKKVTLYSTIPNQEGFNELCDNFGKQVMDKIKERLARDENLPEEENAVFNTADLDNLSEEEAQQLRTTQEGAKKFKSLKANNIAPNEWEQKVQKEYSDIFKEAFENKETVREIKKKRDKKGLPMTPEVFKIIRKIPSFYGYNGPVPASVVEGEDPILFNIQKPITPKGRMVKLNSKANQRYKGYIEKYGEIKTAPIKGAVPLKDVDTAQISNMSTEEKIELARSHGDRAQITAARKALVKEGINWRTGDEMPIKLTPKRVNRLFSRIGKNKDIEYTVYKNGEKMYYSNGKSMFSMDEDGETNGVMPLNQIKAFTENPDTAKVVSFNYKDVVVPYNRDGTVSMPDNSEIVEERKRREVKVPKKVDDENPNSFVSESAKTIMQSPAMADEGAQTLKKAVLDGVFNYEKVANKEALEEANKTIEEKGYEEAYKQWQRVVEGKEQLDVKKIALGVELLNNAVNNNDASRMVEIASGLQMFSTLGAQITQFGNVWRDLTPNGRLYTAQTAVKYINQQQLEKINKGLAKEVTIPASLQEKLLNAGGNLKERERIMEEIQQSIADQLPGTWDEKVRAFRYLSMLGNPRTHIRNVFGNLAMVLPDIAKNLVGGAIEIRIPKDQRTKAPIKALGKRLFGEDKKNIKDFVDEEYERYRPMIKGETKYKGDFKSGIQGKRDIFSSRKEIKENGRVVGYETKKSKVLGPLSKFNSARLEWEDEKFLKPYFKNRYRSAMAARGLTITDLKNNDELRLEIVNIAAKEAQTNTYRDFNARANWINELKRKPLRRAKESKTLPGKVANYAVNFLGEGFLPFTQTPINILKKGGEYSPAGLVKGLEERLVEVKKGNITASEAIDNVAKGLTGTGLVVLGFYLAAAGILKGQGSSDKKQRAIDDLKGEQKNSLQLGDVSYTIDWSAPAIMPVLVGANIYQMAKERDNLDFGTVISGLITIPDTITDLSLLQGVNTAIKAARYSDNPVGTMGVHLLTNYGTQFLPTISGQVARTLDPVRRNAYFKDKSGSNKIPEGLQPTVNKVLAKIPGASMSLTPYIDAWGNVEQKDSRLAAGLENFFSPGYVSKITKDDPATNEVERLYHQTGIGTVVPKNPEKSVTFYGNEQKLSGEQWTDYAINKGKMSYEMVMSAIKAPEYKELPDEVKAKVITDIYDYCGNQAKQKLADEYDDINFFLEDKDLQREQLMELGISPATVFSASKVANTDGNTAVSGAEAFNYLESREDIDLVQRMYMYHYLVPRAKNNPYGNISDYEDE